MFKLPAVHLCIMQPGGYVHSLGFLDPAQYFRHQFRRMGAQVSMSKNRLRHNAVNFIFGAHLGFDPALRERYDCIFVNLEQLGEGGAQVSDAYLQLLANSAVVDYDARNVPSYNPRADDVPVVPLWFAPYLRPQDGLPLAERPIDLLFIGSMNERRRAMLDRVQAQGVQVSQFDSPLYGPERDHFILQSKAVFNAHFYATSRFEQARVSHCLSLGTPVVSERSALTGPDTAFEHSVIWVDEAGMDTFFAEQFGRPAFYQQAEQTLEAFTQHDPVEAYADLLAFAAGYSKTRSEQRGSATWQPTQINLGSGKDYKLGWLNLDILERSQPDVVLDLGRPVSFPLRVDSPLVGPIDLTPGSISVVYANNVLEHVPDLPQLMGNCLQLLKTGGMMHLEVPYEHAATAWQDPTHVRAMNENSWLYYTDWFWYLGWFEHRFSVQNSTYLDAALQPCQKDQAAFMRVVLVKVQTTPQERMTARVMRPDFALPDDSGLVQSLRPQRLASARAAPRATASSL
jgi:SAM-dependent methyltransferase